MSAAPPLKVLLVTHLAAAAVGWHVAPREMMDEKIRQSGVFSTTTEHVLSATVLSLRAEARIRCFSYRGEAQVSVERSAYGLLHGKQSLTVPASVGYYVDLSGLTLDRVRYDPRAKLVTVSLPPLKLGDIAFEPDFAQATETGLLTYSQTTVDELSRAAYGTARVAFIKQAQGATLVEAAQQHAKEDVEAAFAIPLRIVGMSEVRVVAVFADD